MVTLVNKNETKTSYTLPVKTDIDTLISLHIIYLQKELSNTGESYQHPAVNCVEPTALIMC